MPESAPAPEPATNSGREPAASTTPVGEPEPTATPSTNALLRPALHLALDVARIGARSSPVIEPPRVVRPFVNFSGSRLPDAALVAMRRGLDEDEEFRLRVVGLADQGELGRAGWLFVVRPEGWELELTALSEEVEARARADQEEKEERSARRRLAHAEQATDRATGAAAKARAQLAAGAAELATERRARRTSQDEAAQLRRRVTSLEGERDSARRKAGESVADAARLQGEVEQLGTELALERAALEAVRKEAAVAALRAEAERLGVRAAGADLSGRAAPGRGRAGPGGPAGAAAGTGAAGATGGVGGQAPRRAEGALDVAAVAKAVAAAASAASALGRALDEASAALAPGVPSSEETAPGGSGLAGPRPDRVPRPVRRRPTSLPPAVFDDTTEAAAHLVRVPDALILVDGYNAAKSLWPDEAPLELRERLIDALSELVARTGVGIHVVYDGADIGPSSRPPGRRGVRVSFTPADVEADDVILELVEAVPLDRPVVVASSDRRVQNGARQRGANVISSAQLAAVLGRA